MGLLGDDGVRRLLLTTADTGNAIHDEHGYEEGFAVMVRAMGVEPDALLRQIKDSAGGSIREWLAGLPGDASFSRMTGELRAVIVAEAVVWFRAGVLHGERRADGRRAA